MAERIVVSGLELERSYQRRELTERGWVDKGVLPIKGCPPNIRRYEKGNEIIVILEQEGGILKVLSHYDMDVKSARRLGLR